MTRRFVDISIFLENDVVSDPEPYRPRTERITHNGTRLDAPHHFGRDMTKGERAITIDEPSA